MTAGGHASLMTLLLEAGADAQLADTWDNTAWHAAAAAPSPAACRTLPDANVHAANCTGWTALHFAAIKGVCSICAQRCSRYMYMISYFS